MMKYFIRFILIMVIVGTTAKYSFSDEAWPGAFITLDTSPDSAIVYLNNIKLGYTPIIEAALDSGFTNIMIKKGNFITYKHRLYIKAYKQEHHVGFISLLPISKYKKYSSQSAKFYSLSSVPIIKEKPNTGRFPKGMGGYEKVKISALIDKHGVVSKAKIFKSSGNHVADSLALVVIKLSQFTPAMNNLHEPTKCWVNVPLTFSNE